MKRITQFILCLVLAVSAYGQGVGGNSVPRTVSGISAALDLISSTQGTVFYRGASGWEALPPGTSGQLFSTQGAAANPIWVTATGGAGDVNGPGASTANAIARYNGTGGTVIKDSAVTIADTTGAMTWAAGQDASLTGGSSGASLVLGSDASGAALSTRSIYVSSLSVPRSSDPGISIFRAMTGAGNGHGFSEQSDFAKSAGTAFGAFDSRFLVSGTANYDHFVSFQAAPTLSTSGTTTNLYGVYTLPGVTAGTVTNSYGLYVANPALSGSGAITNSWGIYVPAPTGATNNYAATFMGKVGIGKDPAFLLDISGASPRINLADTGTSYAMLKLGNTAGNAYFGRESSAGGAILTGSTAYATVLVGDGATPMQFATDATLRMTLSATGNLLIGTTTDMASTAGGLTVAATGSGATATGVNTGGLRSANFGLSTVSGGASYFGGAVTATSAAATSNPILTLHNSNTGASNYGISLTNANPDAASRNWAIVTNNAAFGDFVILQSNASGGNPVSTGTAKLSMTGTSATFAGAVTAASLATTQTAAVAAAVVSTHKVPIVLNGVTYYILLTNVP